MTVKKRYPLDQSPLFKLVTKKKLGELLGFDPKNLKFLTDEKQYHVFQKVAGDKIREIQTPICDLKRVHKKIAILLSKIEVPDYVYSAKGRSYISNAKQHLGIYPLIKTDISQFYPSITFPFVYRFFHFMCKCSQDVSFILSQICCYKGKHLPTGSPISGYVAYFSSKHIFDAIDRLVKNEKCVMTLYVDDITISGEKASKRLLWRVNEIIRRNGLKVKNKKSISFAPVSPKPVTGVIITGDKLRIPNKLHKNIWETRYKLSKTKDKAMLPFHVVAHSDQLIQSTTERS